MAKEKEFRDSFENNQSFFLTESKNFSFTNQVINPFLGHE